MTGDGGSMQTVISSWIEGQDRKHRDNYVARGRRYGGLSESLLLRSWEISLQCAMATPADPALHREQEDLTAELELRGLAVPLQAGYDAYQALLDSMEPAPEGHPFDAAPFEDL